MSESLLNDYTILEQIGEGGFAEVYLAQHNQSKLEVAIKVIEKKNISSKEREHIE